ncbi:hypothetical protein PFISCL1PPCAC_6585, partial [Pristionchus fissidentatus]
DTDKAREGGRAELRCGSATSDEPSLALPVNDPATTDTVPPPTVPQPASAADEDDIEVTRIIISKAAKSKKTAKREPAAVDEPAATPRRSPSPSEPSDTVSPTTVATPGDSLPTVSQPVKKTAKIDPTRAKWSAADDARLLAAKKAMKKENENEMMDAESVEKKNKKRKVEREMGEDCVVTKTKKASATMMVDQMAMTNVKREPIVEEEPAPTPPKRSPRERGGKK